MLESAIESACVKHATKRGCLSVKLQGGAVGTPDRLFLLPGGRTMIVEFKTLAGRVRPRQRHVMGEFVRLGPFGQSVGSTKTFKLLLDATLHHGVD